MSQRAPTSRGTTRWSSLAGARISSKVLRTGCWQTHGARSGARMATSECTAGTGATASSQTRLSPQTQASSKADAPRRSPIMSAPQ
eukprot:4449715-Prymnesium_polylepis.1